jgi:hypothetical protein
MVIVDVLTPSAIIDDGDELIVEFWTVAASGVTNRVKTWLELA